MRRFENGVMRWDSRAGQHCIETLKAGPEVVNIRMIEQLHGHRCCLSPHRYRGMVVGGDDRYTMRSKCSGDGTTGHCEPNHHRRAN
jgi:hypothetical protein